MFRCPCLIGGWILALSLVTLSVHAQPTITNVNVGTAFRYQGAVRGVFPNTVFPNAVPQSGTLPFRFALWDDPVNTNATSQLGTNIFTTLNINNGYFSTLLDFGDVFHGQRAFLAVEVYAPSNTIPASSNWFTLGPRTEIGAVPYAMWALKGGTHLLKLMSSGYSYSISVAYASDLPFEQTSIPMVVDSARFMVDRTFWRSPPGYPVPPPCLTCPIAITLEVWSPTNITVAGNSGQETTLSERFDRTISAPVTLMFGTMTVGEWISLPLTNTGCVLKRGESLRLASKPNTTSGTPNNYEIAYLRAEAGVREVP